MSSPGFQRKHIQHPQSEFSYFKGTISTCRIIFRNQERRSDATRSQPDKDPERPQFLSHTSVTKGNVTEIKISHSEKKSKRTRIEWMVPLDWSCFGTWNERRLNVASISAFLTHDATQIAKVPHRISMMCIPIERTHEISRSCLGKNTRMRIVSL